MSRPVASEALREEPASRRVTKRWLRNHPFTSLIVMSWFCMALGGAMEWNMYEGFGVIWRVLTLPSYAVLMAALLIVGPLGPWAVIPALIGTLVAGDLAINVLRRAGRATRTFMVDE